MSSFNRKSSGAARAKNGAQIRGATSYAIQMQDAAAQQLAALAAASGRLFKSALAANNAQLAQSAQAMAIRAGRLAKAARALAQQQRHLAGAATRAVGGVSAGRAGAVASANVRMVAGSANVGLVGSRNVGLGGRRGSAGAARSANVGLPNRAQTAGRGRPKGPVDMVDRASLGRAISALRVAQADLAQLRAQAVNRRAR